MAHHSGGQPGNQNARKHGYYSKTRTDIEKEYLLQAGLAEGIDAEIALRRLKLKSVFEHDPANITLISHAVLSLARLMCARQEFLDNGKGGELL
jgi:hypothetical protein